MATLIINLFKHGQQFYLTHIIKHSKHTSRKLLISDWNFTTVKCRRKFVTSIRLAVCNQKIPTGYLWPKFRSQICDCIATNLWPHIIYDHIGTVFATVNLQLFRLQMRLQKKKIGKKLQPKLSVANTVANKFCNRNFRFQRWL